MIGSRQTYISTPHIAATRMQMDDRQCSDVPPPAAHYLHDEQMFDQGGRPFPQVLQDHFVAEGRLAEPQILQILDKGIFLLRNEPNLLAVPSPINIVGDIHGQFYDLLKMFEVAGAVPPAQRFLFLGDYVDRGYFSIECFLYLLAFKISHPDAIWMLRGNHECRHLTRHFTFRTECVYKYSEQVYERCMEAFDSLPLAAVVNEQLFCVHGGISPDLGSPEDVLKIHRFSDPPKTGLFCDLLWSDPDTNYGDQGFISSMSTFGPNTSRGCSFRYTFKAVEKFLKSNNLLAVVRGHEAQDNGYRLYEPSKHSNFPSVITIFSAPNYCDVYNNKAAIIKYDQDLLNIRQFKEVSHPYYLPKFMNAFDWSLPFLGEKIAELLMAVLQIPSLESQLEGLTLKEREKLLIENEEREKVLNEKILALGKIGQVCNEYRSERESLTELENVAGLESLPGEELMVGDDILRAAINTFSDAKESDRFNERLPDRGTLSLSPLPEVPLEYPSPKLAELTDDAIVQEISSVQERSSSTE